MGCNMNMGLYGLVISIYSLNLYLLSDVFCRFAVFLPTNLDCVHTMPAHLKTVKNVTAAKFELAFTRYRNDLKTVGT